MAKAEKTESKAPETLAKATAAVGGATTLFTCRGVFVRASGKEEAGRLAGLYFKVKPATLVVGQVKKGVSPDRADPVLRADGEGYICGAE